MGDFSRDTFNKLKHYVGVRLQQGVPLVDADWNEQDDIRRYELEAFLKWFVGNGIPKGNDGFRILPLADKILLTANPTDSSPQALYVKIETATAADALGFGPRNAAAVRADGLPAQLLGEVTAPFALTEGMTLVISTDVSGSPEETVSFRAEDFNDIGQATAAEVVSAINGAIDTATAAMGSEHDFAIQGGNGTPETAGRCLVEGWDILNESRVTYRSQPLFENDALAAARGVEPLPPLTLPAAGERTDLIYVDVWEREVDPAEDFDHMVNPAIGVETCVRIKREWVVRVAEDTAALPEPPAGHVFCELASLTRRAGEAMIRPVDLTDLRRTGLSLVSHHDMRQIVLDAYGEDYSLDHDGQPNLKVSLREAINALLRGGLPSTPEQSLRVTFGSPNGFDALEDSAGGKWIFWTPNRNVDGIWVNRYESDTDSWAEAVQLTDASDRDLRAVADQQGNVSLVWNRSGQIWYGRYRTTDGVLVVEKQLSSGTRNEEPFVLTDRDGTSLWIFWVSRRTGTANIWYGRYRLSDDTWEGEQPLTDHTSSVSLSGGPSALQDRSGQLWAFWSEDSDIRAARRRPDGSWDFEQLTSDGQSNHSPSAVEDQLGTIWLFWQGNRNGNSDIRYRRYLRTFDGDFWENGAQPLTTDANGDFGPFVFKDRPGTLWVLWRSNRSGRTTLFYNRYRADGGWEHETQLTVVGSDREVVAFEDRQGDIRVTWRTFVDPDTASIGYRKLIPAI